jgi:hypothetical protein
MKLVLFKMRFHWFIESQKGMKGELANQELHHRHNLLMSIQVDNHISERVPQ